MRRSNLVLLLAAERDAQVIAFQGETETWAVWNEHAKALTQLLASRLRGYPGPSTTDDGGDIGGTPAAMSLRRAA